MMGGQFLTLAWEIKILISSFLLPKRWHSIKFTVVKSSNRVTIDFAKRRPPSGLSWKRINHLIKSPIYLPTLPWCTTSSSLYHRNGWASLKIRSPMPKAGTVPESWEWFHLESPLPIKMKIQGFIWKHRISAHHKRKRESVNSLRNLWLKKWSNNKLYEGRHLQMLNPVGSTPSMMWATQAFWQNKSSL